MQWSEKRFFHEIKPLLPRYRAENKWFSSWKDDDADIRAAWNLYLHANQTGLHFLLLGDTKIRKDPAIVQSFGLASGGGVQEEKELAMVKLLDEQRADLNVGKGKDEHHPAVVGKGGVLSDKNWTPLLNDAFVLGGVHARFEFHLAEDDYAGFFKEKLGASTFQARRAVFEHGVKQAKESSKLRWEDFFRANKQMVWSGFPRVFARELVGLKAFGYRPHFTDKQLSFGAGGAGSSASASFLGYLNAVGNGGVSPADSGKLLAGISDYLFDRPDAFDKPFKVE